MSRNRGSTRDISRNEYTFYNKWYFELYCDYLAIKENPIDGNATGILF